jgi:DNA-binding ferritin-like protein
MDDYIIDGFIKVAKKKGKGKKKKPKCKGTESSPVGSPRQKSFCGRMCGHKKRNTKSKTKGDPDSCINQALRRWKCRCAGRQDAALLAVSETVLDGFIGNKTAQQAMDQEDCKLLSTYVAFTRALYLLHQQNHWNAQRYGDHLLFQRLYEEVQELADDAAERVLGLCGELMLEGAESVIAQRFAPTEQSLKGCLESSLAIEKAFQVMVKKTYETLDEKGSLTLGLDDMLMSQASDGETHIYLLQQALKGL